MDNRRAGYRPTSTELYETFRIHNAARKKAQALAASFTAIRAIADEEHRAWVAYVEQKRRETPRGEKFIVPSRPL